MTDPGERVVHVEHVVEGNDSMSLMIDIWLMGFLSGAMSGASTVLLNGADNPGPDQAEPFGHFLGHKLADNVTADPLYIESVREQIQAKLFTQFAGAPRAEVHLETDDPPGGGS